MLSKPGTGDATTVASPAHRNAANLPWPKPGDALSGKTGTEPRCWQAKIGQSGSGKAVLVVDDEPAIRSFLQAALERKGFTVLLAADGSEALAIYGRCRSRIVLVLLDVCLPGWDGPQTLAALQRLSPGLRCCFMTGYAGAYTEQDLLERGAARIFAKPFPVAEMVASIEQLAGSQAR